MPDVSGYQQSITADPQIQAAIQKAQTTAALYPGAWGGNVQALAQQKGLVPEGYHLNLDGTLQQSDPFLSPWLKATLLGMGTAGTLGALGAVGLIGGAAGGGGSAGAGAAAGGSGAGAGAVTGGGSMGLGAVFSSPNVINGALGLFGSLFGANQAATANTAAAQAQAGAMNHAADLQAQAAKAALAFQQQQAALQQQNFLGTQQFNRQVYTDQQARLAPYRAMGEGSLGQLARGIPGVGGR